MSAPVLKDALPEEIGRALIHGVCVVMATAALVVLGTVASVLVALREEADR